MIWDLDQTQLAQGGTYAIALQLDRDADVLIGRLGQFQLPAGHYLYIGSAHGPGGLAARLRRHLSTDPAKRQHWHIDYLRPFCRLSEIWYLAQPAQREHDWAGLVAQLPGATISAPRFGASDCRCPAHLFFFTRPPSFSEFCQLAQITFPGDSTIHLLKLNKG